MVNKFCYKRSLEAYSTYNMHTKNTKTKENKDGN